MNGSTPNGTSSGVVSGCAVCQTPTDKFCSGCKKAFYCNVEHQKSHRKVHKKDCYPAILKEISGFGRCLIASRNVKQGEIIFKDRALVTGPSGAELYHHSICLGCYRQVKDNKGNGVYKCFQCGWPMCSKQCEEMAHHAQYECKVFATNKIEPYFKKPVQYELINTLRSLLLMIIEPEKWKELAQLESHVEARTQNASAARAVREHVSFIHDKCNLKKQFEAELIGHVVGVWAINSFGANPPAGLNPGRARMATLMFPKLCLAAHSCLPNTRGILSEDVKAFKPTYNMELIASLPIKEGEQIHTTYANVNEGTFERRQILRDNYYFSCVCRRCSDATEQSTFFSAFKCSRCEPGYLLPLNPLDLECKWECINVPNCKASTSYSELKIKLNRIRGALHAVNNESNMTTIQQLETILYSNQRKTVHMNHWTMIEVEFLLAMRILGYLPKCQNSDEEDLLLNRLIELCEHCLYIADLIQPGHNSYRGKLLFCLAEAKIKQVLKWTQKNEVETIIESKSDLTQIQALAREAMQILSMDHEGTEDSTLSQKLAKDVVQIRMIMNYVNMADMKV